VCWLRLAEEVVEDVVDIPDKAITVSHFLMGTSGSSSSNLLDLRKLLVEKFLWMVGFC
jgi:hypothetical protein